MIKEWKPGDTYAQAKKYAIEQTLLKYGGNVVKTCNVLEVAPKTIYNVLGVERVQKIREEAIESSTSEQD